MRTVNFILYLCFCGLLGTGALLTWKLPPGSKGGRGLQVLNMDRHDWGDIHFWFGLIMLLATLLHLVLNWAWLKKIASSGHLWRLVLGLSIGLVIIFGIYMLPVEQLDGRGP